MHVEMYISRSIDNLKKVEKAEKRLSNWAALGKSVYHTTVSILILEMSLFLKDIRRLLIVDVIASSYTILLFLLWATLRSYLTLNQLKFISAIVFLIGPTLLKIAIKDIRVITPCFNKWNFEIFVMFLVGVFKNGKV